MKKGDRVELIKQISNKLSRLNYDDIDLTLRQFSLPWSPTWDGQDKGSYCIYHVEQGNNETLLELYEYLHGGKSFSAGIISPEKAIWKTGYFKLFFSHISTDKALVSDVKIRLCSYGIDAFVAHEDIKPTKEWEKVIESALDSCDALAAFLTQDFHKSNWTDQEIGFCLKRRMLIIPIRIGTDPYGFMARFQALTRHRGKPIDIAIGLFDILIEHDLTESKMAPCVVSVFENSITFAEAKDNMSLVNKIKVWTPDLLQRIEGAVQKNRQIRESWGVPEQVQQIVARFGK